MKILPRIAFVLSHWHKKIYGGIRSGVHDSGTNFSILSPSISVRITLKLNLQSEVLAAKSNILWVLLGSNRRDGGRDGGREASSLSLNSVFRCLVVMLIHAHFWFLFQFHTFGIKKKMRKCSTNCTFSFHFKALHFQTDTTKIPLLTPFFCLRLFHLTTYYGYVQGT